MIFSIDSASCCIVVDGINKSHYRNTTEDRAQMLEDCTAMGLMSDYKAVMAEWGDDVPPPALDDLKTSKLSDLESSFDARVSGSFVSSQGWPMQFDRADTLAVEGAIQLLKATGQTSGYLTDANDATHYGVSLATMEAIKVEMLGAYAACHARKQEQRAAINAAQTEEELDAIEITWPV